MKKKKNYTKIFLGGFWTISSDLYKIHKGKIMLIMYYPLNVSRNMDEIKRALVALQTADQHKVSLPLNWREGDKVIVSPPKTVAEMLEREASDYEMVDFYLAKKDL